jgi:hypothetical protein
MKYLKWLLWITLSVAIVIAISLYMVTRKDTSSEAIAYGVSFNTMYARELGLNWEEVYTAILDDLGVKHLRLAAHWTMVSPTEGVWNFSEIDTQLALAEEHGADVVLAVGRRLPRWPECHVPPWAKEKNWEEQKDLLREYLRTVVTRYKDNKTITYWQIENEPFLTVYAESECGDLDKTFLDEEIALVRELDPTRPILVTDSGNLGMWYGAYKRGDSFGTSVYVYLWNETTGAIETILPPQAYIVKRKIMEFVYGKKESMLIELSMEPWLNTPITASNVDLQLSRMSVERFEYILSYAKKTDLQKQYLWGAEWWYWLKVTQNHPEFWERAKELYR